MTATRRLGVGALLLLVGLAVTACGGSAPAPTPTPPAVRTGVATLAAAGGPTATMATVATATPSAPSPTSQPPTIAAPTDTPAPAATNTPAPTVIPARPVSVADIPSPDFGVQVFLWWRPEVADRDLQLVKDHGLRWVRQSFAWEDIEGAGKGIYDWATPDRVVQQVNEHGLYLLARLGTDPATGMTNRWAGGPPGNAQHFADFAGALAARYCGRIQAYQIWNEPNLAREWGGRRPNPAEYVQFLGQAYRAIKAACPTAIVISAGMAPTGSDDANAYPDTNFYEGMYQAMGGNSAGYFDMLGAHAAGFAAPPETDPAEAVSNPAYGGWRFFAFRHLEDIRAIMTRYGDGNKRIAVLEFGWTFDSVNPDYKWHGADAGIDAFVQGCYIVRAYQWARQNWTPWIGIMSVLTMPNLAWIEGGQDPTDEEQYWWAIMEPSQLDELLLRPAIVMIRDYLETGFINPACQP